MATEPIKPKQAAGGPAVRRNRPPGSKPAGKGDPRARAATARPEATPESQEAELKKKLAQRMAFAAVMIAVLLGALALFDQLSGPTPTVTATKEAQPQPQKEVTQPVKPAEPLPEADNKEAAKPVNQPEESAAPTEKNAPPPPAPAAEPSKAAPALAKPAQPAVRPAAVPPPNFPQRALPATKPITPVLPQPKTVTPSGRTQVSDHAQLGSVNNPPQAPQAPTASSNGSAMQAPSQPTLPQAPQAPTRPGSAAGVAVTPATTAAAAIPVRQAPTPQRLFSGFSLQAGVFSSTQRAEELYAKLQLNGIPATMETRVSVGPFKTREEADAAREKMKALGIDSVLLTPRGVRK